MNPHPEPIIAAYIEAYTPPTPTPRPHYQEEAPDVVPLAHQATWADFVEGLRARDDYCHFRRHPWDVLGKTRSYFHTIFRGREVAHLEDWGHFGRKECDILTGYHGSTGSWALLGTLNRYTRRDFASANGNLRERIYELVRPVLDVPFEESVPADAARDAVKAIMELRNFGPAAASRLVALVRPDCLVSVNGKSAEGLGKLSYMPSTAAGLVANYGELLEWVYQQPWFNTAEPDDPLERDIWRSRAALLDAFVYPPINPDNG